MYLLKLQSQNEILMNILFTFHYVSIKTIKLDKIVIIIPEFTFHYVSIKTQAVFDCNYDIF